MSVIDAARGGALTLLEVSFEVGKGVPILGQILALGNVIHETIEKLQSADDKLARLITDIGRLDPIVKKFDGKKVDDDVLAKINALKLICVQISQVLKKWSGKGYMKRMYNAKSYDEKFDKSHQALCDCMDALQRAVIVDTNMDVKEIKLEISDQRNLAMETNMLVKSIVGQMGNAGTPEVSAALANQTNSLKAILAVLEMKSHEGENLASLTRETVGRLDDNLMQMMRECGMMSSAIARTEGKVDALGAKKTVQERRDERLLSMEIDDRDVEWFEDEPFASGSFGAVYRVKYERKICAAKMVSLRDVPKNRLEAIKKEYKKEVALMGELRSNNTVQILGAITRPTELVILMEFCVGGNLRDFLDKALAGEVEFNHGDQCNMLLDVAYGMRYLHGRPSSVTHKDLKSLNVLIDSEGNGKVADFGGSQSDTMASQMNSKGSNSGVGTYAWAAPEVIEGGFSALSLKADVYAFGIIIWECLTQKRPWDGKTDGQIIKAIVKEQRPDVSDDMNKDLRALMESCWSEDPKDRPHFDEIVKRLEAVTPTKKVLRTSSNVSSVSEDGTGDLWERLKADCEATGSNIPVGDDLVMAFEGLFLDGEDVNDRDALISLLDINKNGAVSKPEFKKFLAKWKKSGKSMEAYLGNTGGPPPPTPAETRNGFKFTSNDQLKEAAEEWVEDKEKAKGKYGKIEDWDVSEVTSFAQLLEGAEEFNEDLSRWDWNMSKVENTYEMFLDATAMKASHKPKETRNGFKFTSNDQLKKAAKEWVQDKDKAKGKYGKIEDWDVSEVTSFKDLFMEAEEFNENLSRWEVSNVTRMYAMFFGCSAFNSDLSTWNTSNCTNMANMFRYCSAFDSDLSTWNTSNCTNMSAMFENATSFDSDLSQWDMSTVIYKDNMFKNATAMKASHKPKGV
ncbi:hypothetical protein TrCOL_g2995 [Triparma columacea]|uniref:Calmodulin n=1 Tax=Triparma columacea TaxID=722753 RepID=A0A9W7FY21_9STRA|nr:hypothetical protein TrCOL_g2995 [Triparma columacea]